MAMRLLLDNIRSRYNVGAIFRTADAVGVEHMYLAGRTPTPVDRFGRPDSKIAKTSLGAANTVSWSHLGDTDDWSTTAVVTQINRLQQAGYTTVVVEQAPASTSITDMEWPRDVVLVLGAEDTGVQVAVLEQAQTVLELPMSGTKESLNVSVTAGVVLYHWLLRQ